MLFDIFKPSFFAHANFSDVNFSIIFLAGWVPIYLGILFIFMARKLKEKTINFYLYVALGLMLYLLMSVCMAIFNIDRPLGDNLAKMESFVTLFAGFFIGSMVLLIYFSMKRAFFKPPMDSPMPGEFPQKFFLLEPPSKGERAQFNIYTLSYAIAWGIGLHGIGEGILISHSSHSASEESMTMQLLAIFIHKIVEGIGIAVPIAKAPIKISRFLLLGAIAGFPLMTGYWVGQWDISIFFSTFTLAMAAGILLYGLIMLTELAYFTYRADTNNIFVFATISGAFALFLGLEISIL